MMWIESDLYGRQGKSITNFQAQLPKPDSDLAQQTLKDPYNFEFLTMERSARDELKTREFDVTDVGQINFYLSAIDDQMRRPGDKPMRSIMVAKQRNQHHYMQITIQSFVV